MCFSKNTSLSENWKFKYVSQDSFITDHLTLKVVLEAKKISFYLSDVHF